MEKGRFMTSRVQRLVLPSSVELVGDGAFFDCVHLEHADLSAARRLKCIGDSAFSYCRVLEEVLLNDGLEIIGPWCFEQSGLERVSIPSTVEYIHSGAFSSSSLVRVRFLGATRKEPRRGHSFDNTEGDCPGNARPLVVGERAFFDCYRLRQVTFDPGSAVEEIECKAFCDSGLASFVAPPSLRKIGTAAFRECCNLRRFELNEGIQELGLLFLLGTGTKALSIPPYIRITREQLGLDQ